MKKEDLATMKVFNLLFWVIFAPVGKELFGLLRQMQGKKWPEGVGPIMELSIAVMFLFVLSILAAEAKIFTLPNPQQEEGKENPEKI